MEHPYLIFYKLFFSNNKIIYPNCNKLRHAPYLALRPDVAMLTWLQVMMAGG